MVASEHDSSSSSNSLILKTDTRGHVRTPVERRETLLAEFDRSGLSAKQFSSLAGIKYSTFGYWLQCRKGRSGASTPPRPAPGQQVAWLEAMVQPGMSSVGTSLTLHLPGGVRAELTTTQQAPLAAALVRALEQPC